jgi:hypothetical protein
MHEISRTIAVALAVVFVAGCQSIGGSQAPMNSNQQKFVERVKVISSNGDACNRSVEAITPHPMSQHILYYQDDHSFATDEEVAAVRLHALKLVPCRIEQRKAIQSLSPSTIPIGDRFIDAMEVIEARLCDRRIDWATYITRRDALEKDFDRNLRAELVSIAERIR